MKKIAALLTIVLLLLLNDLKAQNLGNTQPKNELGVSVFGILSRYKRSSGIYHQHCFNGVMYKHHFKNNAIRVGVEYFAENESFYREGIYGKHSGNNKFYSLEYRVGYQRAFPIRKFVVYLSLDIAGLHQKTQSKGEYSGKLYSGTNEINSAGILPGLGLQYKITKHFSVTAETGLNYFTRSYNNDLTISPLKSLSFNYHFR
jgi:hypothetical protein